MANRFEVSTIFTAIDKMTAPIGRMGRSISNFTRNAEKRFSSLNSFVEKTNSMLARTAAAGAAAVGLSLGGITKDGMDFEKQMVEGISKYGGEVKLGSKEAKTLEKAVMDLGSTTMYTNTQVAQAMTELAAAGVAPSQMFAILSGTLKMAATNGVESADAATKLTNALGAWGLMTENQEQLMKNVTRINDVYTKANAMGSLTLEDLSETMKKAAPVIHTYRGSLEEAAAATALLSNAGTKGEIAGTALKNFYNRLASPPKAARAAIRLLGLQYKDTAGNIKPMADIIDQVNKATKKMSSTQKGALITAIFGEEAGPGLMNLFAMGGTALRKATDELKNATGSTDAAFSMIMTTTSSKWDLFKSAISGVSIQLFKMYQGPLNGTIDGMTKWVNENQKLIAQNIGDKIKYIIDNWAQISDAAKATAVLVGTMWALVNAVKALNFVMAMNPYVRLITAIIMAGVAIYTFRKQIAEFASSVWEKMKWAGEEIFKFMHDLADTVNNSAPVKILNKILGFVGDLTGAADKLMNPLVDGIINKIKAVVNFVKDAWTWIGGDSAAVANVNANQPAYLGYGTPAYGGGYQVIPPMAPRGASDVTSTPGATNKTEVTIKDETTNSTVTQTGPKVPGVKVQSTGGFQYGMGR